MSKGTAHLRAIMRSFEEAVDAADLDILDKKINDERTSCYYMIMTGKKVFKVRVSNHIAKTYKGFDLTISPNELAVEDAIVKMKEAQ